MNFGKKQVKERIRNTGSEEMRQKNRFFMFLVVLFVGLFVAGAFSVLFLSIGSFSEIVRNAPPVDMA